MTVFASTPPEAATHSAGFGKGLYICEHPEKPADPTIALDLACRACWLAAKATVLGGGDHLRRYRYPDGTVEIAALSVGVERRASFHGFAS